MIKGINFWISSFIPQKWYWHIVGLIKPWEAVLEDAPNAKAVYNRSKDIVFILKKLKLINKSSEVLDIGCGVGRAEYSLSKEVKQCTGVDISPSMVRLAKKNVKAKNVLFRVGNGKNLEEFQINHFTLVFSILVFQHLPSQVFKNYLKESFRVLRLGGKLFFQIHIGQAQNDIPKNHPWAVRTYQLESLKNDLTKIGFKKIKTFNVQGGKLESLDYQAFMLAEKP